MSSIAYYSDGSGASALVRMVSIRWGGGAHPGKTHVFLASGGPMALMHMSKQCVVDDFGNLVEVAA